MKELEGSTTLMELYGDRHSGAPDAFVSWKFAEWYEIYNYNLLTTTYRNPIPTQVKEMYKFYVLTMQFDK